MNTTLKLDPQALGAKLRSLSEKQSSIVNALPGLHWLVAILFGVSVAAAGLSAHKLKTVVSASRTVAAEKTVIYKLTRAPLTANEYASILSWFQRLHPDVQFDQPKTGGLMVTIKNGAHHADWLYALSALQSRDQDVVWESEFFCVGRCAGPAATALIKGYRQKIEHGE